MDQLVPLLEKQGLIRSRQYNELAKKIGEENAARLSPENLEIAYTVKGDFSSFDELNAKIEEHKKELASVPNRLKNLWNSDDFSDAKKSLAELAKESKITAADIESLAKENKALASFLEESGISAQFAAECFNKLCNGENDFSFITDGVLALDKALNGMEENMEKASKAKSEYDRAMSQDDYNKDFKNYQEAYAAAMEMFEKGEYGRNFRSTMDYLLGEDSYTMSIEEMYDSIKQLENIFGEDSTNGLEFLDKLYGMREILDGTQSSLEKLTDGSYKFNFSTDDFDTIAEHMGMTTDEVTACVSALGMFGDTQLYNINEVRDAIKELEMSCKDGETSILSMQSLIRTLSDMGRSD